MLKKIYKTLKKPYPTYHDIKNYGVIAFIVFIVLAIFNPFGLAKLPSRVRYIIEFGYGIITFTVLVLNSYLIPKIFPQVYQERQWKVYHEIIDIISNIFWIAVGNTIYTYLLGYIGFDIKYFLTFLFFTIVISIFPVTIIILINNNRRLKKNLQDAATLNTKLPEKISREESNADLIEFQGQGQGDTIKLQVQQIYYVTSQKNYLEFCYKIGSQYKKKLIRGALKNFAKEVADKDSLQQCHRSYLVNIDHIQNVSGNSLGYKLTLDQNLAKIPVSRSYTKKFKKNFID